MTTKVFLFFLILISFQTLFASEKLEIMTSSSDCKKFVDSLVQCPSSGYCSFTLKYNGSDSGFNFKTVGLTKEKKCRFFYSEKSAKETRVYLHELDTKELMEVKKYISILASAKKQHTLVTSSCCTKSKTKREVCKAKIDEMEFLDVLSPDGFNSCEKPFGRVIPLKEKIITY